MKCTPEAAKQIKALRTRYPWAVANNEQVVVAVFNYRAEAKQYEQEDAANRVAFDASGCVFEELAPEAFNYESFPIFVNVFDVEDCVWYRSKGPVLDTLFIRERTGKGLRGLKTGSIYLPKDGVPSAAVYMGTARQNQDAQNRGNGLTVEQLMKWVEETMGITSHELS